VQHDLAPPKRLADASTTATQGINLQGEYWLWLAAARVIEMAA
jgi:hypothetical protein